MTDINESRWYLKLLAPGKPIGWTDPSPLYMNAQAYSDLLDDLTKPFSPEEIDLVVATEPFGFIIGAGIATRFGRGVLTVRKDALLAGPIDEVAWPKTSGETGRLVTRRPGFKPGTRVLVVDQWVESGSAMRGLLELVKRQDAVVAGIATLCIEDRNEHLRKEYKCSTAVIPGTSFQEQCNRHELDHFEGYDWSAIAPARASATAAE